MQSCKQQGATKFSVGSCTFLMYVNNIMKGTSCDWSAFTDNFKLCAFSQSYRDIVDQRQSLQRDLSSIFLTAKSLNLTLNSDEWVMMRIGGRQEPASR